MHQKAGRCFLAPPDAATKLVQRRQAKAFRLFNPYTAKTQQDEAKASGDVDAMKRELDAMRARLDKLGKT